jgi:hypothetical protein
MMIVIKMPCLTKCAFARQLEFIVESPTFFMPVNKSYTVSAQTGPAIH